MPSLLASSGAGTLSEYILSNEDVTVAVNLETGAWRVLGVGCKAFWFEWDTGYLMTSFAENVQHLEKELELTDSGTGVPYEVETPGTLTDAAQLGKVTRVYIEINTRGQIVTPSLILTGRPNAADTVVTLPVCQTSERQTREFPVDYTARVFGVRLTGTLTDRV